MASNKASEWNSAVSSRSIRSMMSAQRSPLSLAEIAQVALAHEPVEIASASEKAISASRKVVEEIVARRRGRLRSQHRLRKTGRRPHSPGTNCANSS